MAVLSDQNLAAYKQRIDDLTAQVTSWTQYLSEAESVLNKGTGSTFRTKYAKGQKATTNIQKIIDILQSLKKDLNILLDAAHSFYSTSYAASKK